MSWAWARDKFGSPWWVDLSDEVGNWTDARSIEPPPELAWTAPADASNRSLPAQFVAAVLALGTNVAHPSDTLMSSEAFADECRISWSTRAARNPSDAHLLSSCVLYESWVSSKDQVAAYSAQSVSDLVRESHGGDHCVDMLDADHFDGLVRSHLPVVPAALQRHARLRPADLRRRQAAVQRQHRRRRAGA